MTRDDVHTNILRSTSAALAAGVAGADSITILPCNIAAGVPDGLARRIARNAQVILLEESNLAGSVDPGAGAGAVEALTGSLAEAAWNAFRKIEASGGLAAALRTGTFQEDRAAKVARRQIAITGISTFSTAQTTDRGAIVPPPRQTATSQIIEEIVALPPSRLSEPFEVLRDRAATLAGTGRPAKVFLANLGVEADYSESAGFANNLFAAGGVSTIAAGGFATPAAAADAFIDSGAKVACITGSAETIRQHAGATAAALRRSGAARVYVIGETGSDTAATALTNETDVIEVLSELLAVPD
jgi:methylmalonyl-CoA mutase